MSTTRNSQARFLRTKKFYPPKARVTIKGLRRRFVADQRQWWDNKSRRAQLAYLSKHPCSVFAKRYGVKS